MKQKITITFLIFLTAAILFFACKDEELPEAPNSSKIQLTITEDITSYVSSTINCSLNDLPPFGIEQHGFCWDTISGVDIESQSKSYGSLNQQNFKKTIEGLLTNKTYHVKAYIQSSDVIIYSNELTIQTLDARPVVTTNDVINIKANRAESGGTATASELFPITQRGVCWAKTENPIVSDSITIDSLENDAFSSVISNLEAGELYYVRAYAINSEGIGYGEEKIFETLDGNPDLTTDSITDITATSAIFYGNIENNDGLEILEKGFCWGTITNPTTGNNSISVSGDELGSFYAEVSGLDVNKTYNVRAYLKNSEGTFYGNQITFTTKDGIPDLTTTAITDTTVTTATSGGNITDDGGFAITARGVCWSTSQNPTIFDEHTTDGSGIGSFTSSLTGLEVNTTYYVRAYATNEAGTSYGNEQSFTTEDGLPTLTTTEVTNITATTATSGGNITDDGGFAITARGVCWSTSTNPTISDAHSTDGTGTGSFTSSLTGLTEWSTYYVRAYATNSNGTAYGDEVSFTTIGTSVTDYDGNVYGVVQIGNQLWMAENLKTTHYADGTEISMVENDSVWANLTYSDKAMCYYDNSTTNKDTYGALYTWAAAMNGAASSSFNPSQVQGACPDGWHLPSDNEWKELEMYLGMSQAEADITGWRGTNEGSKLAGNETLWINGNLDNNAEFGVSGFYALPGGYRGYYGTFRYLSEVAYFWSTTENGSTHGWRRFLAHNYSEVYRGYDYKIYGYSVRCIKD